MLVKAAVLEQRKILLGLVVLRLSDSNRNINNILSKHHAARQTVERIRHIYIFFAYNSSLIYNEIKCYKLAHCVAQVIKLPILTLNLPKIRSINNTHIVLRFSLQFCVSIFLFRGARCDCLWEQQSLIFGVKHVALHSSHIAVLYYHTLQHYAESVLHHLVLYNNNPLAEFETDSQILNYLCASLGKISMFLGLA